MNEHPAYKLPAFEPLANSLSDHRWDDQTRRCGCGNQAPGDEFGTHQTEAVLQDLGRAGLAVVPVEEARIAIGARCAEYESPDVEHLAEDVLESYRA
jgi:hypothetical protein